jgi:CDP-diacylglycerol pyrophosphatase
MRCWKLPKRRRFRLIAGAWGLLTLAVSAGACSSPNRDALRQIVQEQCAVHWLQQHSPRPCERVDEGFAVLADRKGGAHFLLIPTKTVAGLESPALFEPGTPNYFAAAWAARDLVAKVVGHGIRRSAVGLALNPRHARTQDQFHIHIECVRGDVAHDLERAAPHLTESWVSIAIDASMYQARRVMGEEFGAADPITLLANGLSPARSDIGDYTLVAAGMDFQEGPGFVLLAAKGPAGELLLDPTCAIAAAP